MRKKLENAVSGGKIRDDRTLMNHEVKRDKIYHVAIGVNEVRSINIVSQKMILKSFKVIFMHVWLSNPWLSQGLLRSLLLKIGSCGNRIVEHA
jgi:hypothetical protein